MIYELPHMPIQDLLPVTTEVAKQKLLDEIYNSLPVGVEDVYKLSSEPIIDAGAFTPVQPKDDYSEKDLYLVDPKLIIARPFADYSDKGWAHEYQTRSGRIAELANSIRDPEKLESIFNLNSQTHHRIKLISYFGPAGPIYQVEDGTHRVAMAKLLHLNCIPAEVQRTVYPFPLKATPVEIDYLEFLKSVGLIDYSDEGSYLLITSEKLPWARIRRFSDFVRINSIYTTLYPNSLPQLAGASPDVLLDVSKFREQYQNFGN